MNPEAFKLFREAAGYTQNDVSVITGISQNTISSWETGLHTPRAAQLPILARLYKCDIRDFYNSELIKQDGEA